MINNRLKEHKIVIINNTNLVLHNTKYSLGSNSFFKKITNYVKFSTSMSYYHRSIFIGILLGDATIR